MSLPTLASLLFLVLFPVPVRGQEAALADELAERFVEEAQSFGPVAKRSMFTTLSLLEGMDGVSRSVCERLLFGLREIDRAPYDTNWEMRASLGFPKRDAARYNVRERTWLFLKGQQFVSNRTLVPEAESGQPLFYEVERGLLVALLERHAATSDPLVRRWAARAVLRWDRPQYEGLKFLAATSSDVQESARQISSFAVSGGALSDTIAEDQLDAPTLGMQYEAAEFLARNAPRTHAQLLRGLSHEEAGVRAICAEGLLHCIGANLSHRLAEEQAGLFATRDLPVLMRALEDDEERVRIFVARVLHDLVRDYDLVCTKRFEALIFTGVREELEFARSALEAARGDDSFHVRFWATQALRELDRDRWFPLRVLARQSDLRGVHDLEALLGEDPQEQIAKVEFPLDLGGDERRIDPEWPRSLVLIGWHFDLLVQDGRDDVCEALLAQWRLRVQWLLGQILGNSYSTLPDEVTVLAEVRSVKRGYSFPGQSGVIAHQLWGKLRGYRGSPHVELVRAAELDHRHARRTAAARLQDAPMRRVAVPFLIAAWRRRNTYERAASRPGENGYLQVGLTDLEYLALFIDDPNPVVRAHAIRNLGGAEQRAAAWREAIAAHRDDEDPNVRREAMNALAKIP